MLSDAFVVVKTKEEEHAKAIKINEEEYARTIKTNEEEYARAIKTKDEEYTKAIKIKDDALENLRFIHRYELLQAKQPAADSGRVQQETDEDEQIEQDDASMTARISELEYAIEILKEGNSKTFSLEREVAEKTRVISLLEEECAKTIKTKDDAHLDALANLRLEHERELIQARQPAADSGRDAMGQEMEQMKQDNANMTVRICELEIENETLKEEISKTNDNANMTERISELEIENSMLEDKSSYYIERYEETAKRMEEAVAEKTRLKETDTQLRVKLLDLECKNKMMEEKLSMQGGLVRYGEFKIPEQFQNDIVSGVLVSNNDVDTQKWHKGLVFCIRHESETYLKREMFPDAELCISVKMDDYYTTYVRVSKPQTNGTILGVVLDTLSVTRAELVRTAWFEKRLYFWYLAKGMVEKHASFKIEATNGIGKPFNRFL